MKAQRFALAWWDGQRWWWVAYSLGHTALPPVRVAAKALGKNFREGLPVNLLRVYVGQRAGCDPAAVAVLPAPPEAVA
jgi:hypothetical protein